MKRKYKNIICIVFLIILSAIIALTVYFNPNKNTDNSNVPVMNSNSNQNTPPQMPSNDNNISSDNNSQGNPPEKPDSEQDLENNQNDNLENNHESDNSSNSQNNIPDINHDNNLNQNTSLKEDNSSSNIWYNVVVCFETFLFVTVLIYLVMSNFNKKSFKETFENKDKTIIYSLSTILLTICLFLGLNSLSNMLNKNNSTNKQEINQNQNTNVTYSSANEISKDTSEKNKEYTSENSDENALLITDSTVSISDSKVTKTGDSEGGDSTSFYGNNSAILVKDKANVTLSNLDITTNATGANGVFSYGGSATTNNTNSDNTTVTISDSKITTKKDNSGGIMTTGGGIMNANNLTVETSGISSAAIRSDRGGGTVNVNGGSYKTTNQGSPAIYSTANITVKNANLTSTASEGVVIEGKNSVTLENVNLTDTNNKLNGLSTTYKNIFLYQSMSGDASVGNSTFTSKNSKIITNNGDTFYVTNTKAIINLENNEIINNDSNGSFLRVQSDSWGEKGSNGGDVTLNLTNQNVKGDIIIDSISTLEMSLKSTSYFEGSINSNKEAKSIKLTLSKDSKLKLTKDSYVSSLDNEDSSNSNIDFNGYKLYVNGKAIN